ncbi:unnamed protein product [Alopecurus aequalis]
MDVEYHEEYVRNSSGLQLFTCGWLPASTSPKALVFLCHGYGMECSGFMRDLEEYRSKSRFLYGESMGGAVALLLHMKDPAFWDGAVLVAPMCKISEKVKPHPLVITALTQVEDVIPKWKIVPTKDVIDAAFKDPAKREKIRKNKLIYQDKPRLKTALEMLRTSMYVEDSLSQVKLPFLVLHGEADTVTDPEVSRALYERAASTDKAMKLYPGMWHGLTAGEPDENVEAIFSDIIMWLNARSRMWTLEERLMKMMAAPHKFAIDDKNSTHHVGSTHARRRRRRGRFLCGLTGRTHHHSEM